MTVDAVELRPHQVAPIKYLLDHPEQKGLLLAHYLGTGKTFTSLAFAEHLPDKEIYILAPEFLRSNWITHMDRMKLKSPKRFHFLSFEEGAARADSLELSGSILIVDEIHHLVALLKSGPKNERERYGKLYHHLNSAERILALSGTPIFTDVSDIAFILNLVSGEELLPLNERVFLDQYTKINKGRSLWRGHLSESHLLIFGLPFVLAAIPLAFISPSVIMVSGIYFGGLALGHVSLPVINSLVPLNKYALRSFDTDKLKDVAQKYISYFDFRETPDELALYPTKKIHLNGISYNEEQIDYFLNFADKSLDTPQLTRLIRERKYEISGDLTLESTSIQTALHSLPGSGREIGNFHFTSNDDNKKLIEAPKFEEIYSLMGNNPQSTVVYSSYFESGTLLFAEFLDRKGLHDQYQILNPTDDVKVQIATIARYNRGETKILLLHPDLIEGISLEATRALHILEPVASQALFEQIVGRVIRLNSHTRLPANERHVDIYAWESTLSGVKAFLAKNNNWANRFSELNSIAAFGTGQSEIDPAHYKKRQSPDESASDKRFIVNNAMVSLRDLLTKHSIDRNFINE